MRDSILPEGQIYCRPPSVYEILYITCDYGTNGVSDIVSIHTQGTNFQIILNFTEMGALFSILSELENDNYWGNLII